MEKHTQEQIIQQQHQALKCPRCDSSNTKFCYYNNYNLSQPRHFCKACKRYWTRGGTLRNVPVGGGCRKNKRLKKAAGGTTKTIHSSSVLSTRSTTNNTTTNPSGNHSQTDHINPLLYGLYSRNSSSDLDFSFQRFNSRVDASPVYEYNLQQKLLGFSSSSALMATDNITTSSSFLTNYVTSPIIGSSNSSVSPSSNTLITASSNLEPEKSISPHSNFFGMIPSYSDMQTEGFNKLNQMEASTDANSIFSVGASWFDPAHFGSSVPSLI